MHWETSRFRIDLSAPRVMGIVNVTPDSFSDGGRFGTASAALAHCERLLRQGAHVLDIGGESSRPGIPPVSLQEELARVLPVLREAVKLGVPVSVDSYKPGVMAQALDLGVDIINDISGMRQTEARRAVRSHPRCGICLMHMHGEPQSMQHHPMQGDALPQVIRFLQETSDGLRELGIAPERIAWDPGIGFGKTVVQNFALLARQRELLASGYALLVGWSRKSSLGKVTGLDVDERMPASVAAALLAVERGAHIVRVHEVRETVAALQVRAAMLASASNQGRESDS